MVICDLCCCFLLIRHNVAKSTNVGCKQFSCSVGSQRTGRGIAAANDHSVALRVLLAAADARCERTSERDRDRLNHEVPEA